MKKLVGKKTYIVSGLIVLSSLISLITGDISVMEFVSGQDFYHLLEGLGISTLRAGVGKVGG